MRNIPGKNPRPTPEDLAHLIEWAQTSDESGLLKDMLNSILRLIEDKTERGDLKIINSALKELRYSFKIFSPYRRTKKVTIFGSARTPEDQPDYQMAIEFSKKIAQSNWMVITGAASGIMKAGHEGAGRDKSFGVNIRLPFEQKANMIIENDLKLINYKYFFTRKLIFIKESDAVVLFPGGFGTHDEGYEALTLVQTGKCSPRPIVMVAPPGNTYWKDWEAYIHKHLLGKKLISPEDLSLFKVTDSVEKAVKELVQFYRIYHSSRFVGEKFAIRLQSPVSDKAVDELNEKFSDILVEGKISKSPPTPEEANEPDLAGLPRLLFNYTRGSWGRLRQMIDLLNTF
ncbi:MAG: LOG family protein [Chlamydiae bacterium]|nr:LOG family protein [Chlamydiota bacterium]MBI3266692.1 LOG family protein [Chlamydiota bacterium]